VVVLRKLEVREKAERQELSRVERPKPLFLDKAECKQEEKVI
jgi:hypothetical protein